MSMTPSEDDVRAMVAAITALIGMTDWADPRSTGTRMLSLLHVVANREGLRPSEIAEMQHLHRSLVTRQLKRLEKTGYLRVVVDPADRRARRVSLTAAGVRKVQLLQLTSLNRFAAFVADWDPTEVRALTALIAQLDRSRAAATEHEQEVAVPAVAVRTRRRHESRQDTGAG